MGGHLDNQLGEIGWIELKQVLYEARTSSLSRHTAHRGIEPLLPIHSPKVRPYSSTHHFVNATLPADTSEVMSVGEFATFSPVPAQTHFPWGDSACTSFEEPIYTQGSTHPDVLSGPSLERKPTQYIHRAEFQRLEGGNSSKKRHRTLSSPISASQESCTSSLSPLSDERVDPVKAALHFAHASSTLASCMQEWYTKDVTRGFISWCLSYRFGELDTLLNYTRFTAEFIEFPGPRGPHPRLGAAVL